jgi:glyoxylase I family protein
MPGNNPTIAGGGFHHLSMRVADLEASIAFYAEGLGCVQVASWGQGERRTVLLDTGDGNYLEISGGASTPPQASTTILHFALRTADCDQAIEAARAAGAEVTVEPKDVTIPADPPIQVRLAFCKGPDGELIEFFQNEST